MIKLLIADDEIIEKQVLYATLHNYYGEDCEIFMASNGREAVDIFEKEKTDICLLDIEMPGISGLEAARIIRNHSKRCSIIFLTAFDDFNYAKGAINVQALDYLLKPYQEEELLMVIDKAIQLVEEKKEIIISHQTNIEADEKEIGAVAKKIQQYINIHYAEDISVTEIASNFKYSEAYFCKFFKQKFGENFTLFLNKYRIKKAKELMKDPRLSIKEIANSVGFSDQNYFAKVFKRLEKITPTEYKQQ